MQTFLPYPSFQESARCLDNRRLGKQRVEAYQISQAIRGAYNKTKAWTNHPATNMWRNYEPALLLYGQIICEEWRARGFEDKLLDYFLDTTTEVIMPWWFGFQPLHLSHRSNLLRKDPSWYTFEFKNFLPPNNLPYLWPKIINNVQQYQIGANQKEFFDIVNNQPIW